MRLCILIAVVLVVGFAPAPFPKRERRIDDSVIPAGKWDFTLWEYSGTKSGVSQYLDIQPGKVTFHSIQAGGGQVTYDFILKPEMSPRGFQWKPRGGTGWVGSYRVRGDELTLIFKSGEDFATRPTNFDEPKVEYRFVLRRAR